MKNTMKYISILLLLATYIHTDVNAQTVSGLDIEEINTPYIFVNPVSRLLNNRVNLSINFGQEIRIGDMRDTGLLDREGKAMRFTSIIDGLNYLYTFGYELKEVIVDPTGGNTTYILMKK